MAKQLSLSASPQRVTRTIPSLDGRHYKAVVVMMIAWVGVMCLLYSYQADISIFSFTHFMGLPKTLRKVAMLEWEGGENWTSAVNGTIRHAQSALFDNVTQGNKTTASKTHGCKFPILDPFDPSIRKMIRKFAPLDCAAGLPIIVFRDGDRLRVNKSKVRSHAKTKNFKHCWYKSHSMIPGTDFKTIISPASELFTDSIELKEKDEHIIVQCFNTTNHVISKHYMSLIRQNVTLEKEKKALYKTHVRKNKPNETLNLLVIGTDGMSKQNFIRAMPKTRDFLLNKMGAIELHKFNKIGLNTFPNVVGLLAGKDYSELMQEWSYKKPLDSIDHYFLWNDFKRAGYRTALMLDRVHVTAFHYLKKGWTKPFVDYYNRPSVLLSEPDPTFHGKNNNCCGDQPEITYLFDYWKQLTTTFNGTGTKPYFGYSFFCRLTHDDQNKASSGDAAYLSFLTELVALNVLHNTAIVFFSDHGERFGAIRSTYNGILEARTPYMFLVFPKWFREKYPDSMNVLKTNQHRLTSHFDVYETMKELVNFQGKTGFGSLSERGISLFKEIPRDRRCRDAGIPLKYCVCNDLSESGMDPKTSELLGRKLTEHIRNFTYVHRKKCRRLQLHTVVSVLTVNPGVNASHGAGQKASNGTYQITIQTTPGLAIYEATVELSTGYAVKVMGDVTRLNMYRGQAECIDSSILRPFCFCIKK